jgi:hypothetical protein
MTTTTATAESLSKSLSSHGYLPPEAVDEIVQIVSGHIKASLEEGVEQIIQNEVAKRQSGVSHVTRIDTSIDPHGYEKRVIGYGEEFTVRQPVVTTVENLLQTAISVSRDTTCTKHFEAAYDAMLANNFVEAFSLLAPVINYGIRPGSINKNPDTVIAQAAYMLLLIGREINNPQSVEEGAVCH